MAAMTFLRLIMAMPILAPFISPLDVTATHRERRTLVFPEGTVLQFSLGIQTPVTIPSRTLAISAALQMQFYLPTNATVLSNLTGMATKREASRKSLFEIYEPFEYVLRDYGLDGRECLLRIICECSQAPFQHDEMGLLEEIAHTLLTPSNDLYLTDEWCRINRSSWMTHETSDVHYLVAECLGLSDGDCSSAYPNCPQSPLDLISEKFNLDDVLD